MRKELGLVIYYKKENRYSFNALLGALETQDFYKHITIYLFEKEENLLNNLKTIIEKHNSVVLAFSFFTTQLWSIKSLIKNIRKNYNRKIIIIAGGPHPTGDPFFTIKLGFDYVVMGEGEETFIEVIKRLLEEKDLKDLKGIAFLDEENNLRYNKKDEFLDFNKYPPFSIKNNKFGPIEITRGCPFVCYFCQTPYIFGTKIRHRSIEKICEYVEIMKARGLTDIRFITPNAFSYGSYDGRNLNIKKLEELLESIRKILTSKGRIFFGSFPSEVRPEHVSEETVKLIKEYANNDNLVIGAQSGSPRILDLSHRGHTVEDVYNAVEITIKAGLKPYVDFIFGLPYETAEDIKLTIRMIEDLIKMGAKIHAHTFIPLPQTPFSKMPAGRINDELVKVLNKLISKSFVFGNWKEQEKIAKKLEKYFKNFYLK
ncbi:MAG: TIGR04013 family B12-binding domain/radical SAM domain-containing protein [Dictyoglomaceae bacterium]